MLGMILWTVYFCLREWIFLASAAFVLSMNFKQMGLYYSMAVFGFILGKLSGKSHLIKENCANKVNILFFYVYVANFTEK